MTVEQTHRDAFKKIIDRYNNSVDTNFPPIDNWIELSNNDLWLRLVGQVMVVGNSLPYERKFLKREDLQKRISFDELSKINDEQELAFTINSVLRECGTKYVNKDPKIISPKAKCLVHNFKFLPNYENGFIGLIKQLKTEPDEQKRVRFLCDNLKFINHKTARDFLMGLGINFNNIAIDRRIQNIFKHVGLTIPETYTSKTYANTEKMIVSEICGPLEILPVKFDRILYQNYSKIMAN